MLVCVALGFLGLFLSGCGSSQDTKSLKIADCGDKLKYSNGSCSSCPFDEFPAGGVMGCVPCPSRSFFNGTACQKCESPFVASAHGCVKCPLDQGFSSGRCVVCLKGETVVNGACRACTRDTCPDLRLRRSDESLPLPSTLPTVFTASVPVTTTFSTSSRVAAKSADAAPKLPLGLNMPTCSPTQVFYNSECTDCIKYGLIIFGNTCGSCEDRFIAVNGACIKCADHEVITADASNSRLICSVCPSPYVISKPQGHCVLCEGEIKNHQCVPVSTTMPSTAVSSVTATATTPSESVAVCSPPRTDAAQGLAGRIFCGEESLWVATRHSFLEFGSSCENDLLFGYHLRDGDFADELLMRKFKIVSSSDSGQTFEITAEQKAEKVTLKLSVAKENFGIKLTLTDADGKKNFDLSESVCKSVKN